MAETPAAAWAAADHAADGHDPLDCLADLMAAHGVPDYAADLAESQAMVERIRARESAQPPLADGTPMTQGGERGSFCVPCWRDGEETGFHPDKYPPCDRLARGPFDPR